MKPEVKTLFDKAAETLQITPETRDTRWRMLRDLNLTANDELLISLVASGRMEELVAQFARSASSIDALPETVAAAVRKAAKEAVGPVAAAATRQVEAVQAKAVADLGPAIAEAATNFFEAETMRRRKAESAFGAMFALLLAAIFAFGGYWVGTIRSAEVTSQAAALALRPDFPTIWKLAQGNSDLATAIGTYCASGSGRVVVTADNLRNCAVSLWIDGKGMVIPPTTNRNYPLASIWAAGSTWLNGFRPLTILGMGLAAGLFLPVLVRWVRTGRQKKPAYLK
ncbi:hypothetical protein [Aureimonas psammosilenae]|uniref:hypothetical protein n=1 Tax=Aureimonas psammosilenae TaxID=2495496 RepID=UPI001260449C|nr:hypothetical protein [Aureimonas psammosilenae]